MPSSPPVVMRDVVQKFGSTTVLHGLDLTVNPGEIVALLGPNGAGKSTAVDIILGLTKPYAGSVEVFGATPQRAVKAGRVAAVQQDGGLLPDLTVKETVQYMASLYGKLKNVSAVLAQAGLEGNAKTLVQKCSGGQKQRLRFAIALLTDPDFLILDEPTAGMDVQGRRDFWASVTQSGDHQRAVLFATHYLAEVDEFADRVVVINQGHVVADGTPAEIRSYARGSTLRATVNDAWTSEQIEERLAELRGFGGVRAVSCARSAERCARDVVSAVSLHGIRLEISAADADAVASHLLADGFAKNLEITSSSLDDAFVLLTETDSEGERKNAK